MENARLHEMTQLGNQYLVDGVRPVTMRGRLEWKASLPMTLNKRQKPLNIGLFDEDARNQMDLFDGRKL